MAERPKIPVKIQNELWARAAGRCEFRGCNKLVFRDALTKNRSNLSVISHIVAALPGGPRGDSVRSPELCTDIQNLMLTCSEHGHLVDDLALVAQYPEALLLEFKKEHEERIQRLTGITRDSQSRVLIFQAPVNGQAPPVPESQATQAILPRYPADERATVLSLNDFGRRVSDADYVALAADTLRTKVAELRRVQEADPKLLSVFALGPIPLLVLLGRELGDVWDVDAYQRHRTTESWSWPTTEGPEEFYKTTLPEASGTESAVLLSVSGAVDATAVATMIPAGVGVYEIRAARRSLDFLQSKARLDAFSLAARDLMSRLHERGVTKVHVFAAVPSPVAVEFGRAARKLSGDLLVYEYDEGDRCYGNPLTITV